MPADSQRIDPVLVEKVGRAIWRVIDPPVGDLAPLIPQKDLEAAGEAAIRVVFDELRLKEEHLREALRAVEACDKTPPYEYEGPKSLNRNGEANPLPGARWMTPREIARAALSEAGRPVEQGDTDGD